jgi:hypothetical protein
MPKMIRIAAAAMLLATGLAACAAPGSRAPSTADVQSGTPFPTSAAPAPEVPGTGPLDQGKRAGSHP